MKANMEIIVYESKIRLVVIKNDLPLVVYGNWKWNRGHYDSKVSWQALNENPINKALITFEVRGIPQGE